MFTCGDTKMTMVALEGSQNILSVGLRDADGNKITNKYAIYVEQCGGLKYLQDLCCNKKDEIKSLATNIWKTYFECVDARIMKHAFLMGFHTKVGTQCALLRSFYRDFMFDENLVNLIFSFFTDKYGTTRLNAAQAEKLLKEMAKKGGTDFESKDVTSTSQSSSTTTVPLHADAFTDFMSDAAFAAALGEFHLSVASNFEEEDSKDYEDDDGKEVEERKRDLKELKGMALQVCVCVCVCM